MISIEVWELEIPIKVKVDKRSAERAAIDIGQTISNKAGFLGKFGGFFDKLRGGIATGTGLSKEAPGGIAGGIGKAMGGVALVFGAAMVIWKGIMGILNTIADFTRKGYEVMKQSSPEFQSITETLDKIFTLTLRPISQLMLLLMRPYLLLMISILRKSMAAAQPIIQKIASGNLSPDELKTAQDELTNIFASTIKAMEPVKDAMFGMINPLLGFVGATQKMLDISNLVRQVVGGIQGFFEFIGKSFDPNIYANAAKLIADGAKDMGGLPKSAADALIKAVSVWDSDPITHLPGQVATAIMDELKRSLSGSQNLFATTLVDATNIIFGGGHSRGHGAGRQFGGPIQNTGLYQLHAGEYVVPKERASNLNSTININVNNPSIRSDSDIRELSREISRHMQINNRRRVSYMVF